MEKRPLVALQEEETVRCFLLVKSHLVLIVGAVAGEWTRSRSRNRSRSTHWRGGVSSRSPPPPKLCKEGVHAGTNATWGLLVVVVVVGNRVMVMVMVMVMVSMPIPHVQWRGRGRRRRVVKRPRGKGDEDLLFSFKGWRKATHRCCGHHST